MTGAHAVVWRGRAVAALLLVAVLSVASQCIPTSESNLLPPGDPLAGDPIDPETGVAAEIVPGAPWIRPGPDEELGTADDEFVPDVRGDVALVVRVRSRALTEAFPAPTPLLGGAWPAVTEFGPLAACPYASLSTDRSGGAVLKAAEEVSQQIRSHAAKHFFGGVEPDRLWLEDKHVCGTAGPGTSRAQQGKRVKLETVALHATHC